MTMMANCDVVVDAGAVLAAAEAEYDDYGEVDLDDDDD
jgi:hypothetical protein